MLYLHANGVVCFDGGQTLGPFPMEVDRINFVAA